MLNKLRGGGLGTKSRTHRMGICWQVGKCDEIHGTDPLIRMMSTSFSKASIMNLDGSTFTEGSKVEIQNLQVLLSQITQEGVKFREGHTINHVGQASAKMIARKGENFNKHPRSIELTGSIEGHFKIKSPELIIGVPATNCQLASSSLFLPPFPFLRIPPCCSLLFTLESRASNFRSKSVTEDSQRLI